MSALDFAVAGRPAIPRTAMSQSVQIAVALYHRDHFSTGRNRKIFESTAFHWGFMVISSHGRVAYDATDASEMDPKTSRMVNPTMDWWFRVRQVDEVSEKLLGCIVIGEVSPGADVRELLQGVPMPVKNQEPQQSCVSWTSEGVCALQKKGWARTFDTERFMDWGLKYAAARHDGTDARIVVEYKEE